MKLLAKYSQVLSNFGQLLRLWYVAYGQFLERLESQLHQLFVVDSV